MSRTDAGKWRTIEEPPTLWRRRAVLGGMGAVAAAAAGGVYYLRPGAADGARPSLPVSRPVRLTLQRAGQDDAQARLQRVAPEGIDNLPFGIVAVHGPGDVTIDNNLVGAFLDRYPAVREGPAVVVSMRGNDSDPGSEAQPLATIGAALRTRAPVIYLEDGVYAPANYARGMFVPGGPRLLIARNLGKVRIRTPGTDLARASWTGGNGVYRTRVESAPHRLVRTDRRDADGFPQRLQSWRYDPASRELAVSIDADPAGILEAFYLDQDGNARMRLANSILCTHGVNFEGVAVELDSTGRQAAEYWGSHVVSFCSPSYGFNSTTGGRIYLESGHVHASRRDGVNLDHANDVGEIVAAGIRFTECGDRAGLGAPSAYNLQAGSSHSGTAAFFGCVANRSLGQEFADTSVPGIVNVSWYVGNLLGDESYARQDGAMGFHAVGGAFEDDNRTLYLDTNHVGGGLIPLTLESGARAFVFNNTFATRALILDGSEAPVVYSPEGPRTERTPPL